MILLCGMGILVDESTTFQFRPEAFLVTTTCYIFHEELEGFKDSKYKEMIEGENINYSDIATVYMY